MPLIPKTLAALAAILAPILLALGPALPTVGDVDLGTVAGILAYVAAALAGLALPRVTFGAHNPLVPQVAVPLLATLVPVVEQLSLATTGIFQLGLSALALVLAFLAGLAAPAPVTPTPVPEPKP